MSEIKTITNYLERRTYIKGRFKGKFIGYLDYKKSDLEHENFYDLEVTEGEIFTQKNSQNLRHWETGEPEEFIQTDKFLTKLPKFIPLHIEDKAGNVKSFNIELHEHKLSKYELSNQVYDGNEVFGDISGEISGYIIHFDKEEVEVEVENEQEEENIKEIASSVALKKTIKASGRIEKKGRYSRNIYKDAKGNLSQGKWEKKPKKNRFDFWTIFFGIIQLLLWLTLIIPILIVGWKLILPMAAVFGVFYLLSLIQSILIRFFSFIIRVVGLLLLAFFFIGLLSFIKDNLDLRTSSSESTESAKEVQVEEVDPITGDSIISNYREWTDYKNNFYSGYLKVRVNDLIEMAHYRNNVEINYNTTKPYDYLVSSIYKEDKERLGYVYSFFDSLKVEHNLNKLEFAKVIASCIQDIPYVLLLNESCDPQLYNDDFTVSYLNDGGKCEGNIRFGLLSPTEFIGSLWGDCDTRTLLLFTILRHYNYDIALLSSDLYRHSIIGINLPYQGLSKTINGKKYVLWELTQEGIPPGIIPPQIADTRYWSVSLISNNSTL